MGLLINVFTDLIIVKASVRQQVYLAIGYTVFCQRPFRRADADDFFQSIIRLAYGGQQLVSGS